MSLNLSSWTRPDQGALFVVTGSSGTGKTTLVHEALSVVPHLSFSVSATTRAPRPGEVDGRDYHFLSREAFLSARDSGDLLEFAEVYGNLYGTPRKPVEEALANGMSILLDIDVQGADQVRAAMPEAVSIFILPPSLDHIADRLRKRSSDSSEVLARRIQQAPEQIACCGTFQYLVINDNLNSAHDQFQAILVSELLKRNRRNSLVKQFTS